jgi:uncharacterized protein (DUF1015 family)
VRRPGLQPFHGGLVRQELASEVVSPPYDALTIEQRAEVLDRHPHSFLGAIRGPEDVAGDDHLGACRRALDELHRIGAFEARAPAFYACRLTTAEHRQTGVVADVPVAWADEGLILGHEQTRAHRAADLLAHLEVVGVTSSPVVLAHRHDRALAEQLDRSTTRPPLRAFEVDDGLAVELWALADEAEVTAVRRALDGRRLYITDGHHRVEAARRNRFGREDEPGPHQHLLGALFSEHELRVEPFHRVARSVGGDFPAGLAAAGDLLPVDEPPTPHRQGTFGVHVAGRWWRLDIAAGPDELAPDVLQRAVLTPLLGIADPTTDPRLLVVPGTATPADLAARATAVDGAAFLVHRVSVGQLMVVADQGRTLPPKSTYFVPKMRSGIFLRAAGPGRVGQPSARP